MIEIIQHIDKLLIDNDCVILPGLGGFVTYNTHAGYTDEDNLFQPPMRSVGFNPQLSLNDGLVIQYYMSIYNVGFAEASSSIKSQIEDLINLLHNSGKVIIPNVGELHYTVHNNYEFIPFENKLLTPQFYGLESFQLKKLSTIQKEGFVVKQQPAQDIQKTIHIRINRAFLRNAVASIAAILLFFVLSEPIENTNVVKGSYAQLLPIDIFKSIESASIITNPINKNIEFDGSDVNIDKTEELTKTTPIALKPSTHESDINSAVLNKEKSEIKISTTGKYNLIISSSITPQKAELLLKELIAKGYNTARILTSGDKLRVSIMSLPTREEANQKLNEIRKIDSYNDAWLLVQR